MWSQTFRPFPLSFIYVITAGALRNFLRFSADFPKEVTLNRGRKSAFFWKDMSHSIACLSTRFFPFRDFFFFWEVLGWERWIPEMGRKEVPFCVLVCELFFLSFSLFLLSFFLSPPFQRWGRRWGQLLHFHLLALLHWLEVLLFLLL